MKKLSIVCFALFFIGLGLSRSARSSPQDAAIQERKRAAVALLRVINTGEAAHERRQNRFCSPSELADAGLIGAMGKPFGPAWKAEAFRQAVLPEPLAGYTMHFTLDAGGRSYSVALSSESDGAAFFTDERGLIYEAKPIG